MKRLLLLLQTSGYRAGAFMDAGARLGADVVVASEEPGTLDAHNPAGLLTLDFQDPARAARQAAAYHREHPLDAVVGVDDATIPLQAAIAEALGLPSNSVRATARARNKHQARLSLQAAGLRCPFFRLTSIEDDPGRIAPEIPYPCVVKPLVLSGSRGVIRADDAGEFAAAFRRLAALLRQPEIATLGDAARQILVEGLVPGPEMALEGLLMDGELHPLALFDKPDPLDGPYFEETIYVTPSRLELAVHESIVQDVSRGCRALELEEGPVHSELRVSSEGPVILEINPRSIGGRCSQVLRFGAGLSLEDIILRRALRMVIPSLEREREASGVMMIPVPGAGVLKEIRGQEEAARVPGIDSLILTAYPGQRLVPLPEGSSYPGFLFAHGPTPESVTDALRQAHARLEFIFENPSNLQSLQLPNRS